jgi:hypothetical protein
LIKLQLSNLTPKDSCNLCNCWVHIMFSFVPISQRTHNMKLMLFQGWTGIEMTFSNHLTSISCCFPARIAVICTLFNIGIALIF